MATGGVGLLSFSFVFSYIISYILSYVLSFCHEMRRRGERPPVVTPQRFIGAESGWFFLIMLRLSAARVFSFAWAACQWNEDQASV